jgi:AbiV family abortive infection protein
MATQPKPSSTALERSIAACIDNGFRLCEETDDLEFRKPAASRFYLAMIAQEEFAKAFLLFLVKEDVVPLSSAVRRTMNDHSCKQLVGMLLDYMIMHWDELPELEALIARDAELGDRFPNDVGSALEILRYEKIEVWRGRSWAWAEDPAYDLQALRVADGKRDQRKQDALYVRIGRDGQVASTPHAITEQETRDELDRAGRYGHFVAEVRTGTKNSVRFNRTMAALGVLFADIER